jgi:hypothetical protein
MAAAMDVRSGFMGRSFVGSSKLKGALKGTESVLDASLPRGFLRPEAGPMLRKIFDSTRKTGDMPLCRRLLAKFGFNALCKQITGIGVI